MNKKVGLHWFRHDLRVTNNEALIRCAQEVDLLVAVYVFDDAWRQHNLSQRTRISSFRENFIKGSLKDLKQRLESKNVRLICISGNVNESIQSVIRRFNISHLSYEFHAGVDETLAIKSIKQANPHLKFIEGQSNYLFNLADLPFSIETMPDTFSPTRRKIEKYATVQGICTEEFMFSSQNLAFFDDLACVAYDIYEGQYEDKFGAGESEALKRVEHYFFGTNQIEVYKLTRNGFEGWDFSSRLSAYLAHGCISPITVYHELKKYESLVTKNDSTYWLFFELLWREFFHLLMQKYGSLLFKPFGIRQQAPKTLREIDYDKFETWLAGKTDFPIINACMLQVAKTGFMSNRGRQLVASCLIHELGLDWRLGADYFEHVLVDFDVASNYGNWQYLAGVGTDPRGLRQFNLVKQAQLYDPEEAFVRKWCR